MKLFSGTNGWTGGAYSIFRVIFGTYLLVHFAQMLPWGAEMFSNAGVLADGSASPLMRIFPNIFNLSDSPAMVTAVLGAACAFSAMLIVGWRDRIAAVGLWYIWACLFGRMPFINNPGLPYVGLLLLAHACLPSAPYGSWARRKQTDPGSSWRMPQSIFVVVWILMAVGYTYSGYTKMVSPSWVDGTAVERVLNNPLARPGIFRDLMLMLPPVVLSVFTWGALVMETAFVPLALIRRVRPWLWLAMLSMHIGLILLIDFADLSLGMVMLHLFTFDPGWIKGRKATAPDKVYYDGSCGLCHGAVRFLLAEDASGTTFRYAPLDSDSFRNSVPEDVRKSLPDSMVVLTPEGEVLIKSDGWARIMHRLGGLWRLVAWATLIVPHGVRDWVYDRVASVRKTLFAQQVTACPILPKELRARFEY